MEESTHHLTSHFRRFASGILSAFNQGFLGFATWTRPKLHEIGTFHSEFSPENTPPQKSLPSINFERAMLKFPGV